MFNTKIAQSILNFHAKHAILQFCDSRVSSFKSSQKLPQSQILKLENYIQEEQPVLSGKDVRN